MLGGHSPIVPALRRAASGAFDEEYLGRAEILLPLMLGPEGASGDGEPLP
jgi:hypothetical protein